MDGKAFIWILGILAVAGYCAYLNAWEFLIGFLVVAALCCIGIISDIMERPRHPQGHEKSDACRTVPPSP